MEPDDDNQPLIEEIRTLLRRKCGRKPGLLYDRWTQEDVGIRSTGFAVIGRDGIYEGYYTEDRRVPKSDDTIVRNIVRTEECMEWETMSTDELQPYLDFLKNLPDSGQHTPPKTGAS